MGLADMLIKLGITYGSSESLNVINSVYKIIAKQAILTSAELAKNYGAYEGCNPDKIIESSFVKNLNFTPKELDLIRHYGLRNSQLLTCAPTGSIASMFGVSTGVEPIYAIKYTRTTKSLEGKDVSFKVYTPIAEEYLKSHDELPSYFIESSQIDPKDRIKVQSMLQTFIDASISSTLNLPKEASIQDIYNIYMDAWKQGLKGVTVYRENCAREAILNKESSKTVIAGNAPKRPKSLPAIVESIKVKGERFAVYVGLYENKPYEIFAHKVDDSFIKEAGIIIKKAKGIYSFKSEHYEIENLIEPLNIEEQAATLYSSMLLRHGVDIKYIIKTARKVNDNITSFSSAMCRVLARYIPKEETGELCPQCGAPIVKEGGCEHCSSCEWSKCLMLYNYNIN